MAETVTVACKLPMGLHLDDADSKTGVRTRWATLRGFSTPFGVFPENVAHGVGLTHGVDANKFQAWMETHKDSPLVANGLVFAHTRPNEVVAKAKDEAGRKSGFEPLTMADLPAGIEKAA